MSQRLYFSRHEVLKDRDKIEPLTPDMEINLSLLLISISKVREAWGRPLKISSGYRPPNVNSSVGGVEKSAHMSCQAVDIVDNDGYFANWCLNNLTILEKSGIFMEDPRYTPTWVHLQIRPVKSGNRVFIP